LASIIKKRTIAVDGDLNDVRPLNLSSLRKKKNAGEMLSAAVTAKVEDGNIKAAIRILCSDEKLATDVKGSYEKLLERHPDPPFDRRPAQPPDDIPTIQVSESEVMSAIRSFPAGSSGGPDGVRPQLIMDLVNYPEWTSSPHNSESDSIRELFVGW
jgi:hypothetical protein